MTAEDFEEILNVAVIRLCEDVRASTEHHAPDTFERRVQEVLENVAAGKGIRIGRTFHDSAFPDLRANGFGVEVKTTNKDAWQNVGNSVFEGMRDPSVKRIYVIFGKMGGLPAVRWGTYEDKVTHVRTSHAPRFVIEMEGGDSLFKKMGISYDDFSKLPALEKMRHIRKYSRARLRPGELLWWLDDENSPGIPVEVRLYMSLSKDEKRKLRAETTVLFPEVLGGSRVRGKYTKAAFYLLNHHNVFCPQTRDLFSAGSVAGKVRGGNYLQRALKDIEPEMREAIKRLNDELFEVYWGRRYEPHKRITEWLRRADEVAKGWKPSDVLFISG